MGVADLVGVGFHMVAYDKAQIAYQTQTIMVGGNSVTLSSFPVPGQVDLYLLQHSSDVDLEVSPEDVTLLPPNPMPIEDARITAVIHNQGDIPVSNVDVAFYDGVSLIGNALIPGPLVGGGQATAEVIWDVPVVVGPHQISVVVDPFGLLGDVDPGNNTAVINVFEPDAVVDSIVVNQMGAGTNVLTIRVQSEGPISIQGVDVDVRLYDVNGPTLQRLSVPDEIVPGGFQDVTYVWTVDPQDTVDEFDETNNSRGVHLRFAQVQKR